MKKIGIIGSGISGLTAAFLLKKKGFEVVLFERSERAGGNIQTVEINDFLIEYAPNSLLKSPRLVDLIRELKLEAEVLAANPANKKRYVLRGGRLKALPMSLAKMVTSDYFSARAKLRLLKEPFIGSKSSGSESVAGFFERRLGREIVERAADPFIAGIYAGSPENLSIKAAFPRLFELEKNYGSLLVGALRSKAEKTDKNFPRTFSFKNGVQTLTDMLAEKLGESVKTGAEVLKIEKLADGKWSVLTEPRQPDGIGRENAKISGAGSLPPGRDGIADKISALREIFDALVISTPAGSAAKFLEKTDANLSAQLENIYYPPVAMVFFGVKKEKIARDPDGFGFLIPSSERRRILGTIWNSAVFENRAPEGYHLLTTFVGGARNAELFEKSDDELFEIVYEELQSILGLREKPSFAHLKRWPKAIPQYLLGYEKIERSIAEFEHKNRGFYFCSNFYKGISVGDCVKNAFETADQIEELLREN
jgi:protoporphyrinogen/coproporphyrinogen III oxidase